MKKTTKTITALGLATSVLMTMPLPQVEASTETKEITVKAANLYLRSGNSFDAKPIRVLHKGETYKVYDQRNGMYNIGGNQWVTASSKYVNSISSTENKVSDINSYGTVKVTAVNLNIRSDASFSSRVVSVAHQGQSFTILSERNGLYQIGQGQWISASPKYVSTSNNPASTPSVSTKKTANTVIVNIGSLNIRSAASFSSRVVGVTHKGQSFTILSEKNGLYQIGQGQWISASSKYVVTSIQPAYSSTSESAISSNPSSNSPITNSKAQQIINYGKQFMGMPYVWASSNPKNGGFDCSGFIYYAFKNNGYNISRLNVEGYWNTVQRLSSPQVGDLVFFKDTYRKGPSHIGIYIGNNKFLHSSSNNGVTISSLSQSYYKNHFLGYGRL